MLSVVYGCSGILIHFIITMMLTNYVFLIAPMKNRFLEWLYRLGACAICLAMCVFVGAIPSLVTLGLSIGGYIFFTMEQGKRKNYFSILQLFPIMGLSYGLIMPLKQIPVIFFNLGDFGSKVYSIFLYSLFLIVMLLFVIRGREWRKTFHMELKSRNLQQWEKVLLYIIGMLMFLYAWTVEGYVHSVDSYYREVAMHSNLMTSVICLVVTMTVIILILQGNKSAHLRNQVMKMQHDIIITMADIVENRDENTGGHIKRTAKYVEIIAVTLKVDNLYSSILTDQYIADMIIAAPLHDIGKIHVPDYVLKKQGKLTDEEYTIMKDHTTAGKKLLIQAEKTMGKSSYLDMAIEMAASHHEWWNGRGYPEGLKGQDIPLCARIMAVADVFDAIVSQRCYKGALSIDEAYDIIRRESGTHFDPVVVEAFLEAREEITEVLHEFREKEVITQNLKS
ncbi:MAG: HD-GYP domain-containing protein [Oscillospiraceae bacterium]